MPRIGSSGATGQSEPKASAAPDLRRLPDIQPRAARSGPRFAAHGPVGSGGWLESHGYQLDGDRRVALEADGDRGRGLVLVGVDGALEGAIVVTDLLRAGAESLSLEPKFVDGVRQEREIKGKERKGKAA